MGLAAGLLVCGLAALAGHASLGGLVADPDSFYHIGHARRYASGSVLDTSFPWARFSVIGDRGADLWWGYHLLLVPFAAAGGVLSGIHAAGVAATTTLLATVWLTLRRHGVAGALVWTLVLFVAVPNVLFRLLMVRPHVLSLAAALVVADGLARGRPWVAAAAAAGLAWMHASLFWMAPVVLGAHAAARFLERRWVTPPPTPALPRLAPAVVAVLGGTAAGLALRPRPLATLSLVDVQLLELVRRRGEEVLRFGGELRPLPLEALLPATWLLLVPWCIAVAGLGLLWRGRAGALRELPPRTRVLATTCALTSIAFLAMALGVAGRALVEWAVFGTVAAALSWRALLPPQGLRRLASSVLVAVVVAATPWLLQWHRANVALNALPGDTLREAAEWMAERSAPGDLVFHAHWDSFGPLFAWNRTNHYLGGMDPIFQYAHDPERWSDVAALAGRGPLAVDPGTVIADGFAPRWVLVEPFRDPALYEALRADPRFDLARLTRSEAVFGRAEPRGAADAPAGPAGISAGTESATRN